MPVWGWVVGAAVAVYALFGTSGSSSGPSYTPPPPPPGGHPSAPTAPGGGAPYLANGTPLTFIGTSDGTSSGTAIYQDPSGNQYTQDLSDNWLPYSSATVPGWGYGYPGY